MDTTNTTMAPSPLRVDFRADTMGHGRPMRVLVADDEEPVRDLMARVLARGGCDVVAVSDGAEAVEAESDGNQPFDVVVLDMAMPRKNGVQAYREIARHNSASRFLFTSAYYESRLLNEVLREGRSGFLPKPFLPGCILEEVQNLIAGGATQGAPVAPSPLPILFD
jgi:two-component system, cell cycle sensor histidine kinase and response regulator CckA